MSAADRTPVYHVDAFTDRPFRGNPAAVCLLDGPRPDAWMQGIALDMNLSETAFVSASEDAFTLRWFTPAVEVELCGHATLAAAHVLWSHGGAERESPIRFFTKSGLLECHRMAEGIAMDFPSRPVQPVDPPPGLLEALDSAALFVGFNRMDFLVEVESETAVRSLTPNFAALAKTPARGVIVTARSDDPAFDFVSRFFAPAAGVDEDPVTGSAHCALGPYWAAKLGKMNLKGLQRSRREGVVGVEVHGERVNLIGKAVTVASGELHV